MLYAEAMLSPNVQIVVAVCGVLIAVIGLGNTLIGAAQVYYSKKIDASLKLSLDYQIAQGAKAIEEVKATAERAVEAATFALEAAIAAHVPEDTVSHIDSIIKSTALIPKKVTVVGLRRLAELSGKAEDMQTANKAEEEYRAFEVAHKTAELRRVAGLMARTDEPPTGED